MSSSNPPNPSMAPAAGLPPSGNGKYIVVVIGPARRPRSPRFIAWKIVRRSRMATPRRSSGHGTTPRRRSHENPDDNVPLPPPPEEPVPELRYRHRNADVERRRHVRSVRREVVLRRQDDRRARRTRWRTARSRRTAATTRRSRKTAIWKGHVAVTVRVGRERIRRLLRRRHLEQRHGERLRSRNCVANMFRSVGAASPPPKGGCLDVKVPISVRSRR